MVQQEALAPCAVRQSSPVLYLQYKSAVHFSTCFVNRLLKFHHRWDLNSVSKELNTKPKQVSVWLDRSKWYTHITSAHWSPSPVSCPPVFTQHQPSCPASESLLTFLTNMQVQFFVLYEVSFILNYLLCKYSSFSSEPIFETGLEVCFSISIKDLVCCLGVA